MAIEYHNAWLYSSGNYVPIVEYLLSLSPFPLFLLLYIIQQCLKPFKTFTVLMEKSRCRKTSLFPLRNYSSSPQGL